MRLNVVLRDAQAVLVTVAEKVLGFGIALLGGEAKPLHRFGIVELRGAAWEPRRLLSSAPFQSSSGECRLIPRAGQCHPGNVG